MDVTQIVDRINNLFTITSKEIELNELVNDIEYPSRRTS